ncbi:MAG: hypothetical protein EOP24_19355 [Hyphomicrobiales bacterium]|nr:MAG: hypothetical protein EOP24_19355 [Hyphomicrobiales bacterium]
MAQSLKSIERQIQALQQQAEKLRSDEVKGVVDRIKVAIAHYGLTAEQLGFSNGPSSPQARIASKGKQKARAAQFADSDGNEWSGRGPRPRWLRDALSAGRSLEEFKVTSSNPSAGTAATKTTAKRRAGRQYRDQSGNSWTGMGPRPQWLRAAMEAGASLEQLKVSE